MKPKPPVSKITPELDLICEEFGLEKKIVCYRNMPVAEHGYLKAYSIWLKRNGYDADHQKRPSIKLLLATRIFHHVNKLS